MNRLATRSALVFTLLVSVSTAWASSSAPPNSRTGAPATGGKPAESLCTGCHSGNAVNSSGSVTVSGVPTYYTPGTVYPVTLTLTSSQNAIAGHMWGFEVTVIKSSDGTGAGTFTNISGQGTGIRTGSGNFATRSYLGHSGAGLQVDVASPVSWQFQWTAPSSGTGGVVFYFAGLAADGDGSESGEFVYNGSFATMDVTPTLATSWGRIKAIYR
jgi:hypothetical protein